MIPNFFFRAASTNQIIILFQKCKSWKCWCSRILHILGYFRICVYTYYEGPCSCTACSSD